MQVWNEGTYAAFKPRNSWYTWLTQQAAIHMMRINHAEWIERRLRDLQALRAIDCWESDPVHAAAVLGADLTLDPERVVGELWCTPAGRDWMIDRWEGLAAVPAAEWTEAQQIDPAAPPSPRGYWPSSASTRDRSTVSSVGSWPSSGSNRPNTIPTPLPPQLRRPGRRTRTNRSRRRRPNEPKLRRTSG